MRKSFNKIKKLFKRSLIYRHGSVIAVESNAMLVIITIGRILQKPRLAAHSERDDAVILPCRMINSAGIALIFTAKLAFRISALLHFKSRGNCAGVFFRL